MQRSTIVLLIWAATAAWASEQDAQRIQATLVDRHLPHGTILDPVTVEPGGQEIASYTRCGDSAIWTGHYLAAQAFRHAVAPTEESLAEVNRALDGVELLVGVTGTGLLARCAFPASSPYAAGMADEEKIHGLNAGRWRDEQWQWIGNTSRDQYIGVFFGLTTAWNLVQDAEVQARVAALTTQMLEPLMDHAWTVVMPDGSPSTTFIHRPDQQLSLLKLGRRVNPGRFEAAYKALANSVAWAVSIPVATEVREEHDSYFKFNLDYVNFWNLLTSGDNTLIRSSYKRAYDMLRRSTDDHGNAHFNLIDRAINGANAGRDEETRGLLDAWLKRSNRDYIVDLRGAVEACGERACRPIPVEQRTPTDFLWQRSPFQLWGGGDGYVESNGIDYLLPYWMGRYYQVVRD